MITTLLAIAIGNIVDKIKCAKQLKLNIAIGYS